VEYLKLRFLRLSACRVLALAPYSGYSHLISISMINVKPDQAPPGPGETRPQPTRGAFFPSLPSSSLGTPVAGAALLRLLFVLYFPNLDTWTLLVAT
jgi:hypothetical protein